MCENSVLEAAKYTQFSFFCLSKEMTKLNILPITFSKSASQEMLLKRFPSFIHLMNYSHLIPQKQ